MTLFSRPVTMARRLAFGLVGFGALTSLALPAQADSFSADQKTELGSIVHDYLMAHPEVIRDAMVELDRKDKADEAAKRDATMASKADTLFNSPYGEVIGNPQGKATLVEFFD